LFGFEFVHLSVLITGLKDNCILIPSNTGAAN
jgi:hypothetical protein